MVRGFSETAGIGGYSASGTAPSPDRWPQLGSGCRSPAGCAGPRPNRREGHAELWVVSCFCLDPLDERRSDLPTEVLELARAHVVEFCFWHRLGQGKDECPRQASGSFDDHTPAEWRTPRKSDASQWSSPPAGRGGSPATLALAPPLLESEALDVLRQPLETRPSSPSSIANPITTSPSTLGSLRGGSKALVWIASPPTARSLKRPQADLPAGSSRTPR